MFIFYIDDILVFDRIIVVYDKNLEEVLELIMSYEIFKNVAKRVRRKK